MNKTIMIVMPAYNEAPRIGKVIRSVPKVFTVEGRTYPTRVVIVDDGSKDGTVQEAKTAGATVLKHVMNSGAGAATRTGLRYAANQPDIAYVATLDADGQHATSDVERMLGHALKSNADVIIGSRLHAGNKQAMPFHRRFGNRGLDMIGRVLFGITTRDTQSGLRLFKAEAVPIIADYTIDRYGFCTEMLWLAFRAGLRVDEVPTSVTYSAETLAKGQSNWGVVQLLKDLIWIRISG
jgi:glycosyltransferase involved in cell wall biosynthesis